jgi:ABC-type amino acid transport system permease subunit
MNEGLIVTLLIINIALSAAALLGVFVALGMISRGKEE